MRDSPWEKPFGKFLLHIGESSHLMGLLDNMERNVIGKEIIEDFPKQRKCGYALKGEFN